MYFASTYLLLTASNADIGSAKFNILLLCKFIPFKKLATSKTDKVELTDNVPVILLFGGLKENPRLSNLLSKSLVALLIVD